MMKSKLFSPITIGKLELPNRLVRSATHEGLAEADGLWSLKLVETLEALASGEVGLIITGHAFITPGGRAGRAQAAADRDECVPLWRDGLARIHSAGGRIMLQLAHAGGFASDIATAAGPSAFAIGSKGYCHALTLPQINHLLEAYTAAAVRAQEAGFDGIQLHAAHGYLLSEFLSPVYNRRTDNYGGSLENRARFLGQIVTAIRGAVGSDFPLWVKINSEDFCEGGFSVEESLTVCRMLESMGVDAIELSGGIPAAPPKLGSVRPVDVKSGEPVYYENAAKRLKAVLGIPIALVGGIRSPQQAESLLEREVCDLISLSRPLIREPGLPSRWCAGDWTEAECIRCNACFRPILTGKKFGCALK